jgi:hypothetical protein
VPVGGPLEAVVVIQCSDPRYQVHCQDFLQNGLRISRYALLAVPGGVQTLTLVDYLPKFSWAGWRWLKFLRNLMQPDRIVLIAHDDCRWYFENRFAVSAEQARARQVEDLRRARAGLIERFGPVQVDLFYATLDGDRAIFRGVAASPQP